MQPRPIEAGCRRCGNVFLLREVVEARDGTCPRCGRPLAPDYTTILLDEAGRADSLQREFITCLARLAGRPATSN